MSTETKWTPRGPWRVIHSSWETSIVFDADGALVAEVHIAPDVDEDTQHIYEPQKDKRAVFLAAAPALYEALELMSAKYAELLDSYEGDSGRRPDYYTSVIDEADAALASARGEG